MFDIGVRLHDLLPNNLDSLTGAARFEARLKLASEMGFSCIHLASKLIYQDFNLDTNAPILPDVASQIHQLLDAHGLHVAVLGAYRNILHPTLVADVMNKHADKNPIVLAFQNCFEIAHELNADCVGTECGRPNADSRITDERTSLASLRALELVCRELIHQADICSVRFAIEPGFNEALTTPERLCSFAHTLSDTTISYIYDPVSLLHPKLLLEKSPTKVLDEQLQAILPVIGTRIVTVHMKDCTLEKLASPDLEGRGWTDGSGYQMKCVAPGLGLGVRPAQILNAHAAHRNQLPPVIIENSNTESAERARAYIEHDLRV